MCTASFWEVLNQPPPVIGSSQHTPTTCPSCCSEVSTAWTARFPLEAWSYS